MVSKIMRQTALLLILFYLASPTISAQEPLSDRMDKKLKSEEFNVSILLQSLGIFSFTDGDFNGNDRFDVGATRLVLSGNVDNGFIYKFQAEFGRSPSFLDVQVGYSFSEKLAITGGAYKVNLSYDLDPNPGKTDFIDRARQVGAIMNSREIGVTLEGKNNGLYYRAGIYNGNGLARTSDGNFLYAGRLGYTIESEKSSVSFGINAGLNQTENERVGNTGLISAGDRTILGVYADVEAGSFFGTVEFLQSRFHLRQSSQEETITGFYGTLGTNISDKDQILGRLDHLEFDTSGSSSDILILGWNRQFTRLFSFQLNGLLFMEENSDEQFGLNANFQFQF